MNQKSEIRKKYLQKRALLETETIENKSISIANQLLQLPIWDKNVFHIFMTIENQKEIDTSFIINILMGKDKEIVVPKMNTNHTLSHYLLTDNTKFKLNKYQIPEPENGILIAENQIDVVFVPLLALDTQGNRIGYGKGFYDQFLKICNPHVVKIGLSFFEPEPPFKCVENHDIQLDYAVTPQNILIFNPKNS
ncbi:MAG: 5-formyltetrahydrofolate cyclo-ligase [Flavobacterium sp.]